jgi:hypothetical protein
MSKMQIFCTSIQPYSLLNRLPEYISPLGLGDADFPKKWMNEKKGENIKHLNKYYGEISGFYWVWKNKINEFENDDFIGFCHYRKFWLNYTSNEKSKYSYRSLFDDLLNPSNNIFKNKDVIQVQPIVYKNRNLFEDFKIIHKTDILNKSLNFLDEPIKSNFSNSLRTNTMFPLNMFIVRKSFFIEYCETLFPWLERCTKFCEENKLLKSYNTRLPAFLAERFTSFWFSQFDRRHYLSYARVGSFFLSEKVNNLINPLKISFTSRMYPTIHKY